MQARAHIEPRSKPKDVSRFVCAHLFAPFDLFDVIQFSADECVPEMEIAFQEKSKIDL